jgi:thymidine phosphorylase
MRELTSTRISGRKRRSHALKAKRLGINTHQEAVVYMRADCHVCRSEGLTPQSRVLLRNNSREVIATLHHVASNLIDRGEAGLSEATWERLGVAEGDHIYASHPRPVESLSSVRHRIYGHRIDASALQMIVSDIVKGRYSDIELSSFITACASLPLDEDETIALTTAMVNVGERLAWPSDPIMDKHSIGGLPGNRTSPIVVSIVAAFGLTMPKTSSRAITSPAGTADAMETLAPVDLDLVSIRKVVEEEGGCIAWGGAVRLSPADDILIRIERALEVDSEGQLVASVLSKKIAAGSTHLVLDVPVGRTAKVRTAEAAQALSARLQSVAGKFGLETVVMLSNGDQPVGRGIGPALEARDVLSVLQNHPGSPRDLKQKACEIAGALLEMGGLCVQGDGMRLAATAVEDGRAWRKFQRICEAQGGMRVPPVASHQRPLLATCAGMVAAIDNRRIARLAKLAGAPEAKAAGVEMRVQLGDDVVAGQPLCVVHASTPGELHYALDYAASNPDVVGITPA